MNVSVFACASTIDFIVLVWLSAVLWLKRRLQPFWLDYRSFMVYNRLYPSDHVMKNLINLDVLVVYSATTAMSATVDDNQSSHPFLLDSKFEPYNTSYAYFLEECRRNGMNAGFTTSQDITGPGTCQSYWTSEAGNWRKMNGFARSMNVFDKISPTTSTRAAERKLLLSDTSVKPFNDRALFLTFFDKLLTFQELPEFTVPTVALTSNNLRSIATAIKKLALISQTKTGDSDFSSEFVLKDRYGAGGDHVYKISATDTASAIKAIMVKNPTVQFVLQPFLLFDKGYTYEGKRVAADIRLIFNRNRILQSYIRRAKADDFRCNEHKGGQIDYISHRDIPFSIKVIAKKIVAKINQPHMLYALDFVTSNAGNVYFIEGNCGPGLDWNASKKVDEQMSKQLIETIVGEFADRTNN